MTEHTQTHTHTHGTLLLYILIVIIIEVYGLVWINSKTHSELMTGSADGTVKFWDIRMFDKLVRRKVFLFPALLYI